MKKKHWKYLQTSFCQYSPTINFRKGWACQANADGQLLLKCELTVKKSTFYFLLNLIRCTKGTHKEIAPQQNGLIVINFMHIFHLNSEILPFIEPYSPQEMKNKDWNSRICLKYINTLSILLLVSDLHPLTTSKCMLLKSIYMLLSLIKKKSFIELL